MEPNHNWMIWESVPEEGRLGGGAVLEMGRIWKGVRRKGYFGRGTISAKGKFGNCKLSRMGRKRNSLTKEDACGAAGGRGEPPGRAPPAACGITAEDVGGARGHQHSQQEGSRPRVAIYTLTSSEDVRQGKSPLVAGSTPYLIHRAKNHRESI